MFLDWLKINITKSFRADDSIVKAVVKKIELKIININSRGKWFILK